MDKAPRLRINTDALSTLGLTLHDTLAEACRRMVAAQEKEVERMLAEWPLPGVEPALLWRGPDLLGLCRADIPLGEQVAPIVRARPIVLTLITANGDPLWP